MDVSHAIIMCSNWLLDTYVPAGQRKGVPPIAAAIISIEMYAGLWKEERPRRLMMLAPPFITFCWISLHSSLDNPGVPIKSFKGVQFLPLKQKLPSVLRVPHMSGSFPLCP